MKHHDPVAIQSAKQRVLELCDTFDRASPDAKTQALERFTNEDYLWRGMHPFDQQVGAAQVVDNFWAPLCLSFTALQRRVDVFFAGHNALPTDAVADSLKHKATSHKPSKAQIDEAVWTCQMGHFMGLMDKPWLDIPPTNRMVFIRFVEFHLVHDNVICQSALFFDLIGVMRQCGHYPLPPSTGASFIYPGPATNDGVLLDEHPQNEAIATQALIDRMVNDLSESNRLALQNHDNRVPRETLAKCWDENMIWYGPEGIGATYTIDRYQQQHQYPFRYNLSGKTFNGHVARVAEGNYGAFFGWPNLSNQARGGFLGLPAGSQSADMRVVDVYRRDADKLVENWVIIDLPHWLSMQGLDVLSRMRQLLGIEKLG